MKKYLWLTAFSASVAILSACSTPTFAPATVDSGAVPAHTMSFQLVRNSTFKVEYAGTTFLVDPMLASKGAYPGFNGTHNGDSRIPLVELPIPIDEVLKADAIIVTHLHHDHWDDAAKTTVPRAMKIYAQNQEDAAVIRSSGFTNVEVLQEHIDFHGTRITKTPTQHGSDQMYAQADVAKNLGDAMGLIFSRPGYKTLYLSGDTIWTPKVESTITNFRPDVIVLNATFAPIFGLEGSMLMRKEDILRAYALAPRATILTAHLETVNPTVEGRQDIKRFISERRMDPKRVLVPADGERFRF